MSETFGELLSAARVARRWTRGQLAKKANYTDTHIRDLELGARAAPCADQVMALCAVLAINDVPMLRASIKRRKGVELTVAEEQVATAALLARAWPHMTGAMMARLDKLLTEAMR